jgi:hypothetical protein
VSETANLDDLVRAAMAAPAERIAEALRVLRGESADVGAPPPPPEPYLKLKEVAVRLKFSPGALWLWQVPGHDLGGRRRFKLSEVAAYLESDRFKSRAAALRAERRHKLSAKGAIPHRRPNHNSKPTKGA